MMTGGRVEYRVESTGQSTGGQDYIVVHRCPRTCPPVTGGLLRAARCSPSPESTTPLAVRPDAPMASLRTATSRGIPWGNDLDAAENARQISRRTGLFIRWGCR